MNSDSLDQPTLCAYSVSHVECTDTLTSLHVSVSKMTETTILHNQLVHCRSSISCSYTCMIMSVLQLKLDNLILYELKTKNNIFLLKYLDLCNF